MTRRYIAALFCAMMGVSAVAGIEIVDVRRLGEPELPPEFLHNHDLRRQLGFAEIAWIGRDTLLYKRAPLYWQVDIRNSTFLRSLSVEDSVTTRTSGAFSVEKADAALIDHGNIFEGTLYGFYSVETGWIDIDRSTFDRLWIQPTFVNDELRAQLAYDWEYRLLGGHAIVPRPVYGAGDIGVSLRRADTGETEILPIDFFEFRDNGNYTLAAVSFDRFRIALVARIVRREETDPYDWGWNLWVMRAVYDGMVRIADDLWSEPFWESPVIARLDIGTTVTVHDADRYTITELGEEDFWYRVEHEGRSGWMFGGSLMIEGEDWRKRLDDRGRPLDVDALLGRDDCHLPALEVKSYVNHTSEQTQGGEREVSR